MWHSLGCHFMSVIRLNVILLSKTLHNVFLLSVILLSGILLNVFIHNVAH